MQAIHRIKCIAAVTLTIAKQNSFHLFGANTYKNKVSHGSRVAAVDLEDAKPQQLRVEAN